MPLHWPFAVRTFPHDGLQLTYPMGDYCTPRLPSSTPQLSESIRLTVTASVLVRYGPPAAAPYMSSKAPVDSISAMNSFLSIPWFPSVS